MRVGGSGIPKIYAKFWWPSLLSLKKWHFYSYMYRGGGGTGLGNIPKQIPSFLAASLRRALWSYFPAWLSSGDWRKVIRVEINQYWSLRQVSHTTLKLNGIFNADYLQHSTLINSECLDKSEIKLVQIRIRALQSSPAQRIKNMLSHFKSGTALYH